MIHTVSEQNFCRLSGQFPKRIYSWLAGKEFRFHVVFRLFLLLMLPNNANCKGVYYYTY